MDRSIHADWSKIVGPDENVRGYPRLTAEEVDRGRWSGNRRVVFVATVRSLPGSGFKEERFFEVVREDPEDVPERERMIVLMSDGDSSHFIWTCEIGRTYERLAEPRYVELWCGHECLHEEIK